MLSLHSEFYIYIDILCDIFIRSGYLRKFFMTLFLQLICTCLCLLCEALLLGEDVAITGDCVTTGTGRASKRVLALENLEETMRCTRQRAMKQVSTTSLIEATEVGLEPDLSANQNQGDTNNTGQGKWLPYCYFIVNMCGMLHSY